MASASENHMQWGVHTLYINLLGFQFLEKDDTTLSTSARWKDT